MSSLDRRRHAAAQSAFERHVFDSSLAPTGSGAWYSVAGSDLLERNIIFSREGASNHRDNTGTFKVHFAPDTAIVSQAKAILDRKEVGSPAARCDAWETDGDHAFMWMAPRNLDQAVRGGCHTVSVEPDKDNRFYVLRHATTEQPFKTRLAALEAGERLHAVSWDGLSDRLATEAGLDPNEWVFMKTSDGIWFENADDQDLRIERRPSGNWAVVRQLATGQSPIEALDHAAELTPAPFR